MAEEKAIAMEPVKEKLRNLRTYMPKAHDGIYTFGQLLAERLNPEIVPDGFYLAAELLVDELQKGVDGRSGKKIINSLTDNPPVVYWVLRREIPNIAKAVCPEDFAAGVKTAYDEVQKRVRNK